MSTDSRASPWGSRHPSPWGRPPEVDGPEDHLGEVFESEPHPRKKDAENDDPKHWWSRWKAKWRPGGFSSSKSDERTEGEPRSRTSNGQHRFHHHRDKAQCQQRKEQVEQERTRTNQEQNRERKPNDAKDDETRIGALFAAGDRAILKWTLSGATDYEQFCVDDDATNDNVANALFAALTAMQQERDRAVEVVNLLVQERKKIREYMATQNHSVRQSGHQPPPDALYRKVGLDPDCSSFLLTAARKAYRKELHPDVHPAERKAEAPRRFQDAEAVFNEIERQRGRAKRD